MICPVRFSLNGETVEWNLEADTSLLDALREHSGIVTVRACCEIGMCGTCTVLVDGKPASSCLLLVPMVSERTVVTLEGSKYDGLTDVQRAFIETRAFQCSYCIPGMVLTLENLRRYQPDASRSDAVEELRGNLCRCGSYANVLEAVNRLFGDESEAGKV